ncbi:HNH endonuclease, partial [Escherichia coli]|uniref:HNH endonuclease n=1 Tax=Escherichia coli TaxID=562 RepID=UPI001F3320A7
DVNGEIPDGMIVDHIDGNTSNNSIKNLRLASKAESSFNKGMFKNNTSGVKGVYWDKRNKKWMAYGTINGKMKNLGRYSSIEDAKN